MKRFLALLTALTLSAALTACGGAADPTATPSTPADDLAYVKEKGTLVVGITNFAPMDYKEAGNDEWIGFDADMARAFAEELGVDVEFTEITWGYKVMELDARNIDCVWNGMTVNDEVRAAMSTSTPYCKNAQVLVVPADKAEEMAARENLEGLSVAVEDGSAGEDAAAALGAAILPVTAQSDTLMEVSAGSADAAVIDLLMAGAMLGENSSYKNLTYTLNLNELQGLPSEEYAVGFRTGSTLTEAFNTFWAEQVESGAAMEVATRYGLQESIIQ